MIRYWQKLCPRSIWIKVSIAYQRKRKSRNQKIKVPKAFTDCSKRTDDVYENLKDFNPTKKSKVLIVFDNMIADMEGHEKLSAIVTELF